MFYKLRNRVLQVSLEDLEPKPIGRPAFTTSELEEENAELTVKVAELERELQAQSVRLELSQTMPQIVKSPELSQVKKTNRQARLRQHQAQKLAQLKREKRK